MKKLIIVLTILLLSTKCYADHDEKSPLEKIEQMVERMKDESSARETNEQLKRIADALDKD